MKKMLFLGVILIVGGVLALLCLQPGGENIQLPQGESVTLSRYDGEKLTWKLIYEPQELEKLKKLVSEARITQTDIEELSEDPRPIYGITVHGREADFEAVWMDGIWLDNQGRVVKTGLDFKGIWELFQGNEDIRHGIAALPCVRELALFEGNWDRQFLTQRNEEIEENIPMELDLEQMRWTIENRVDYSITHGNGGWAALQVRLEGKWYDVPQLSGSHYGVTLEAYELRPGERYTADLWMEPYGQLPPGDYRLVFDVAPNLPGYQVLGCAAAEFRILEDGGLITPPRA